MPFECIGNGLGAGVATGGDVAGGDVAGGAVAGGTVAGGAVTGGGCWVPPGRGRVGTLPPSFCLGGVCWAVARHVIIVSVTTEHITRTLILLMAISP